MIPLTSSLFSSCIFHDFFLQPLLASYKPIEIEGCATIDLQPQEDMLLLPIERNPFIAKDQVL